jgi:transcriptional regulator with XRE-family HTH domain
MGRRLSQKTEPHDARTDAERQITPLQCRMARAGLGWTTRQLADLAKIAPGTINRFEKNEIDSKTAVLTALRETFEAAGIEFIERGVRLRR